MKLSVILNTARPDFPFVGLPDEFIFERTIRSLAAQTEPIHEIIIVDPLGRPDIHGPAMAHARGDERSQDLHTDFALEFERPGADDWRNSVALRVLRPDSPLAPAYVTICAAKNTGLRAATGDAVWFIDDGMEAPPHATTVIREYIEAGMWPSALCHYYEGGVVAKATPAPDRKFVNGWDSISHVSAELFGPGGDVKDARYGVLDAHGWDRLVGKHVGGEWWRGYTAAPTEQLRAVGGFDETLDGVKGMEDPDLGLRMVRRWGNRLAVDRRFWVAEHRGAGYAPEAVAHPNVNPKCNYAIIQNSGAQGKTAWGKLTRREVDTMAARVCPSCPNRARCEGEHLAAKWRPTAATAEEIEAYAAWERACVEG